VHAAYRMQLQFNAAAGLSHLQAGKPFWHMAQLTACQRDLLQLPAAPGHLWLLRAPAQHRV
jgi:hypothetical protein